MTTTTNLIIRGERFSDVVGEVEPLLERHWEEIALNRDFIPLSPDYAKYSQLEADGALLVVTARDPAGGLVGYAAFFAMRSIHYSTVLWATNDVIWMAPEHRTLGGGSALLEHAEHLLRLRGCAMLHINTKILHPQLAALCLARGYEAVETVFAKVLQRPE
jgi:GNAT superfamily N-acetyltransferase